MTSSQLRSSEQQQRLRVIDRKCLLCVVYGLCPAQQHRCWQCSCKQCSHYCAAATVFVADLSRLDFLVQAVNVVVGQCSNAPIRAAVAYAVSAVHFLGSFTVHRPGLSVVLHSFESCTHMLDRLLAAVLYGIEAGWLLPADGARVLMGARCAYAMEFTMCCGRHAEHASGGCSGSTQVFGTAYNACCCLCLNSFLGGCSTPQVGFPWKSTPRVLGSQHVVCLHFAAERLVS